MARTRLNRTDGLGKGEGRKCLRLVEPAKQIHRQVAFSARLSLSPFASNFPLRQEAANTHQQAEPAKEKRTGSSRFPCSSQVAFSVRLSLIPFASNFPPRQEAANTRQQAEPAKEKRTGSSRFPCSSQFAFSVQSVVVPHPNAGTVLVRLRITGNERILIPPEELKLRV
jgi:hypothetical protein